MPISVYIWIAGSLVLGCWIVQDGLTNFAMRLLTGVAIATAIGVAVFGITLNATRDVHLGDLVFYDAWPEERPDAQEERGRG